MTTTIAPELKPEPAETVVLTLYPDYAREAYSIGTPNRTRAPQLGQVATLSWPRSSASLRAGSRPTSRIL